MKEADSLMERRVHKVAKKRKAQSSGKNGRNGSRKRSRPLFMMFRPIFTNVASLLLYATSVGYQQYKCKTIDG